MTTTTPRLSATEYARFKHSPVNCPKLRAKIQSLADFFAIISSTINTTGQFWFRGHASVEWDLTPSALRYSAKAKRTRALELLPEFKRVAEIRIPRPPRPGEDLMWVQLAQHYGLPTRLLDWTESATIALFFACEKPMRDGLVFVLNPIDLNRLSDPKKPRVLDAHSDEEIIRRYLRLGGKRTPRARSPIAVNPVWNSERLMLQKGVFTLHGARFSLDGNQVPSLVALPILRESKLKLRSELERVGVDEMAIFPELEHSCRHMKRRAGLEMLE